MIQRGRVRGETARSHPHHLVTDLETRDGGPTAVTTPPHSMPSGTSPSGSPGYSPIAFSTSLKVQPGGFDFQLHIIVGAILRRLKVGVMQRVETAGSL